VTTGERILELVPATSRELLAQLDIRSTSTLHKWITRLRKAGELRVGQWNRNGRDYVAVYVRGPGRDARRPKPWTQAQLAARYRQGLKDAGLYEDYLADMRKSGAKYRRRKGQGHRLKADPLMKLLYRKI